MTHFMENIIKVVIIGCMSKTHVHQISNIHLSLSGALVYNPMTFHTFVVDAELTRPIEQLIIMFNTQMTCFNTIYLIKI